MKNELDDKIAKIINEYKTHYDDYAFPYQEYAQKVYELIHGNIDWGNKKAHNAKIHLNKLGLAQDNWKASLKRGLMNFDDWMEVTQESLMETPLMSGFEAKKMVELLLRDENAKVKVADCLGLAFVENLATLKVNTIVKEVKGPNGKLYKSPRTNLIPLDIWDIALDPDCSDSEDEKPLYRIQTLSIPKHILMKMADDSPTMEKPYLLEAVKSLVGGVKSRKTEQDIAKGKQRLLEPLSRKMNIVVMEFYGTILDDDGTILEYTNMKGETFLLEDVLVTIADGTTIIGEPRKLDKLFINGEDPYVQHRLLRNNKDILGRAMGHAGYEINKVLDEYTSAMTDAGIKAASNMTYYKPDFMLDPEEAADGFSYDSNIAIMPDADPNSVLGTLRLGDLPPTMFNVHRILSENFAENVSKNSTALSGAATNGATTATESAQAGQTVAALDESILMDVDDVFIEKLIMKIFHQGLNLAKFFNDIDLAYIFSSDEKKIEAFKDLRKSKKKLFEELGYSFRFRGRGLRGISNQARVGQMTMNLLTSVLGNPTLIEILERMDWDLSKMLSMGVKGMGIDPETLKDAKVGELARERQNFRELGRGVADQTQGNGNGKQQGVVQPTQRITDDRSSGNSGGQ